MTKNQEPKLTNSISWEQQNTLEKYPVGSKPANEVLRFIGSRGMPDEYAAVYELKDAQGGRKAVAYVHLSSERQGSIIPVDEHESLGLPPFAEAFQVISAQHAERLQAAIDTGVEGAALQEFSPPRSNL